MKEQIQQLSIPEERTSARTAYQYLMHDPHSSYMKFVELQASFLSNHPCISENDLHLQLPRRCIEEVGLECAVWPHLYPRTKMRETHVRHADSCRQQRNTRAPGCSSSSSSSGGDSSAGEGLEDVARKGYNSANAPCVATVLGTVAEYG